MNKLSHSQAMKFQDCAKAWELHYRKKLRPRTTSSALLFGKCLDSAVETYLKTQNQELAHNQLLTMWKSQEINKKQVDLFNSPLLVYANSDYDKDVLDKEGIGLLNNQYPNWREEFPIIVKQKEAVGYKFLSLPKKQLFNAVNWVSMLGKGKLMLDKVIDIFQKNLVEVLGTQVLVELKNDVGDTVTGYADFIVRWKGYELPLVLDLKTSSIEYKEDSVLKSPQLSLYIHDLEDKYGTRMAGYLVIRKRMLKQKTKICSVCGHDGSGKTHRTCPQEIDGVRCGGEWDEIVNLSVDHQLIISEIPKRTEEIVLENMDMVNESIKSGIFPRNFGACEKPWGLCPYYEHCFHNKNDELVCVDGGNDGQRV